VDDWRASTHQRRPLVVDAQGSSLIEVLVAVALLGTVFVAVLAGMSTSIKGSDIHRRRAETENVLVSGSERLKETAKVACATTTTASYVSAVEAAATAQGWAGSRVRITAIRYWDGTTYGTTCYDNATNRLPLQQITIEVTHPRGKVVQPLTFVKGAG
jgi:type II secretory pathway pseudopilin PulG